MLIHEFQNRTSAISVSLFDLRDHGPKGGQDIHIRPSDVAVQATMSIYVPASTFLVDLQPSINEDTHRTTLSLALLGAPLAHACDAT